MRIFHAEWPKGWSHLSFSPSAKLRLVLSTLTPSRGCQGWCVQGSLHRTLQMSSPTAQRSPGDPSTGMNSTYCTRLSDNCCDVYVCVSLFVHRSRVYMADLESTLHYSLRSELAAHAVIKGDALFSLKKYISVLVEVKLWALHTHTQFTQTHTYTHRCETNDVRELRLIFFVFIFCL